MSDDFLPTASIESLRQRARVITRIREFFDGRGFFEVQTPALSRDIVVDRFIEPLSIELKLPGSSPATYWLQTSPEFAMKRLLAAGATSIYQIGPAFRADEVGELHNIEFTMLEWYRVGDRYHQGIDLLDELAQFILKCAPATRWTWHQAFKQFCGIDLQTENGRHEFARCCGQRDQVEVAGDWMVQRIEPALRELGSVILYDWPSDQSALARIRREPTGDVAERFELYVDGVELANGYHELTDAGELLSRNTHINQKRRDENRPGLPVESHLLDAMRHGLPASCGVALGVDRLVMLALGKRTIREVMAFDSHRA